MLTSIEMGLLGQLIFRVAVCVDRAIQLLERHKSHDKLIIRVEESAEPLLVFHVMNLYKSAYHVRIHGEIEKDSRIAESFFSASCRLRNAALQPRCPRSAPSHG